MKRAVRAAAQAFRVSSGVAFPQLLRAVSISSLEYGESPITVGLQLGINAVFSSAVGDSASTSLGTSPGSRIGLSAGSASRS